MKKLLFASAFLLLSTICISQISAYYPISSGEIIEHTFFTLSYNSQNLHANWSIYALTRDHALSKSVPRTALFSIDPLISGNQSTNSDYYHSGYDRGHLSPAANFRFSKLAMSECFYLSNISPQEPSFNRGIWKRLEAYVRKLAIYDTCIYVITGPVFSCHSKYIGSQQIPVPAAFFKIIYKTGFNPYIRSWLIPGSEKTSNFQNYSISLDSLEKVSGIDFVDFDHKE